jgi:predicted AAA+ superfamily ATPase
VPLSPTLSPRSAGGEREQHSVAVSNSAPPVLAGHLSLANSPSTGEYITTILQRNVRDLARVDALHTLPNLLKLLAARASGLLNLADIGRDAGLPHTTLTRYLALLETVFLVHRLPAWSRNLGKRLAKRRSCTWWTAVSPVT